MLFARQLHTLKDTARVPDTNLHDATLSNLSPAKIAGSSAPQIVEEKTRHSGRLACALPQRESVVMICDKEVCYAEVGQG